MNKVNIDVRIQRVETLNFNDPRVVEFIVNFPEESTITKEEEM